MSVPDPMAALRARAVDLAAKLAETERALYIERALRQYPQAAPGIELITALDEPGVRRQAHLLHKLAGGAVEPEPATDPEEPAA